MGWAEVGEMVPQITQSYAMRGFNDKNQYLELNPEAKCDMQRVKCKEQMCNICHSRNMYNCSHFMYDMAIREDIGYVEENHTDYFKKPVFRVVLVAVVTFFFEFFAELLLGILKICLNYFRQMLYNLICQEIAARTD